MKNCLKGRLQKIAAIGIALALTLSSVDVYSLAAESGSERINTGEASVANSAQYSTVKPVQAGEDVSIDEINFPDENFREYVKSFDTADPTGELSPAEQAAVESVKVEDLKIKDLKGIEYFTNLQVLNCKNNQINRINLEENTLVNEVSCNENPLTYLCLPEKDNITLYADSLKAIPVTVEESIRTIDLSKGIFEGIDSAKITAKENLTVDTENQLLKVIDPHAGSASYQYACSAECTITANLNINVFEDIAIDEEHFPDEKFRNYVVEKIDVDKNRKLCSEEMNGTSAIDIQNNGISSIQGIEYFSKLEDLNCMANNLTQLNLRDNINVKTLNCSKNQLSDLDVTQNRSLEDLNCSDNGIQYLNIRKNGLLKCLNCNENSLESLQLEFNEKLATLCCRNNQLKVLQVDKNTLLQYLDCGNNKLETLDLTSNENLEELYCGSNEISSLNMEKNAKLIKLVCDKNKINELILENNTNLQELRCEENQISTLDTTSNSNLTTFYCSKNPITYLTISQTVTTFVAEELLVPITVNSDSKLIFLNKGVFQGIDPSWIADLKNLILSPNEATLQVSEPSQATSYSYDCGNDKKIQVNLDVAVFEVSDINEANFPDSAFREYVSDNIDLDNDQKLNFEEIQDTKRIEVQDKTICDLKGIEHFSYLTYLDCSSNLLTCLDLEKNIFLQTLLCYMNQLDSLKLNTNTELEILSCGSNNLENLDLQFNTKLTTLHCNNNKLSNLEVSNQMALTSLYCQGNHLNNLDVTQNTLLDTLSCNDNQISSLNLNCNTELQTLCCYNNDLTNLDVKFNKELTHLYCFGNQLTSLDLSDNQELISLECSNNKLTALNLTSTKLNLLYCSNNLLKQLNVEKNTKLQYLYCDYNEKLTGLNLIYNTELKQLNCGNTALTYLNLADQASLESFEVSDLKANEITVEYNNPIIKLNQSPFAGIDFEKIEVSDESNLIKHDGYLQVKNPDENAAQYIYNCGLNKTMEITLQLQYLRY